MAVMYDFLRKIPLFAELPDEDLERLCEAVEEVHLPAGQDLFPEGAVGDRAYVIRDGQLEIVKTSSGREVLLAVRGSGEVIGEMALLEDRPRMATVRARTDCVLYGIGQMEFKRLLETSASAVRALFHTFLSRWQATEAKLRQSEKMAQLGKLTAGVAHELNNPAAAVKRGADHLRMAIGELTEAQASIGGLGLDPRQQQALQDLASQTEAQARQPLVLDVVARSDREAELEEWLEDQGMEDAWEFAPMLVNLGFDRERAEELAGDLSAEQLGPVINWLSALYDVHSLLAEISQGAGRLSEIVKALKSYSYLDQAPVQQVDVHRGLEDTLLILRTKLQSQQDGDGITVRREYAEDLPLIQGYGSELNQVWTNLIDNAADALDGKGEISLRTRQEGDWVVVEISDNGPGIPPEVQPRIFDPFFTTKAPGVGTGLGLDIVYNIIVYKHKGDVKVFSRPGRTTFQVWLPRSVDGVSGSPSPVRSFTVASEETRRRILQEAHSIAVVGISADDSRPAHRVPAYLQSQGYRIIPVNPRLDRVLGEQAYPDLASIPGPVDVVQIFRRSDDVLPHVQEAIDIGAPVVWMQLGILNEQAAELAREAGLEVVMDACMMNDHRRLLT